MMQQDTNCSLKTKQKCIVLARSPILEIICKNGRAAPAVEVLLEIPTQSNMMKTLKICFVSHLGESLGQFICPTDLICLCNLELDVLNTQHTEILLGYGGYDNLPQDSNDTKKVIEMCEKNSNIQFQYLPEWTQQFYQWKENLHQKGLLKVWDKRFKNVPIPSIDILFTDLVHLQERAIVNFFACVVEACLPPRFVTLPSVGEVAAMNITVVDPSISQSFRTALLTRNNLRLSVMIWAPKPELLPTITCGDIIQVIQGGFYVSQDMKIRTVYLNCRTDPAYTHLSLWHINKYGKSCEDNLTDITLQVASPQWENSSILFQYSHKDNKFHQSQVSDSLPSFWETVATLAQWVNESLYDTYCFKNEYTMSLYQTCEPLTKKYCDILVYTLSNVHQAQEILQKQSFQVSQLNGTSFHAPQNRFTHFHVQHPMNSQYDRGFNKTLSNSSNVASICFHVYDVNGITFFKNSHQPVLVHLINLSLPHNLYLSQHIDKGDCILLKNLLFIKLLPNSQHNGLNALDVYEFDASRCRSVKIPFFSKEVQPITLHLTTSF
ncbi:uncharacterized protein LOC128883971 isoform X2 [Hylaeus volcanicus]|uniref:uncharacterized protein LOC128883971 isoform X2 n=1 Tax=Hylaeus volcanicus TaxID=313075 RepID=UPI0023B7B169|nr:uncharacterized protein LOC128883971 isoform X2 [Hylaeus volcanicus]